MARQETPRQVYVYVPDIYHRRPQRERGDSQSAGSKTLGRRSSGRIPGPTCEQGTEECHLIRCAIEEPQGWPHLTRRAALTDRQSDNDDRTKSGPQQTMRKGRSFRPSRSCGSCSLNSTWQRTCACANTHRMVTAASSSTTIPSIRPSQSPASLMSR